MKVKKENVYGVKIGDIFCYELGFITFFQVVDLRGTTQVVVKEIEKNVIEDVSFYETKVIPLKDKFKEKSKLLKKWNAKDISNKGDIKTVSLNYDGIPQLTGLNCPNASCILWDGENKKNSYWGALCR